MADNQHLGIRQAKGSSLYKLEVFHFCGQKSFKIKK